jgi:hypothetical protein
LRSVFNPFTNRDEVREGVLENGLHFRPLLLDHEVRFYTAIMEKDLKKDATRTFREFITRCVFRIKDGSFVY